MPSVVIEVRREYSTEQEIAIIDAVQSALVQHFQFLKKTNISVFSLIYRIVLLVHHIKINLSFILKLVLMHLLDVLWMQSEIFIKGL
jgi:hypothetical protein